MPAPIICVFGNVTKDPELKYSQSGSAWGYFTVANTEWRKNANDEWEEAGASFYDVKVFGEVMENVAESVSKGTRVMVLGKLRQENWETDGQKRSKMVVIADEVAVSLKNATASVTKVERNQGDGGYHNQTRANTNPDEDPFRVDAGEWWPSEGIGEPPKRML